MNNSELRLLRYLFIDQFVVKRGVKKEQQTTEYAQVTERILHFSSPSPATPFEENITYTVFDLETTGFYPHMGDEVLSIGAVKVKDGQVLKSQQFYEVVKPFGKVSSFIKKLTGLTEDELGNGISFSEALNRFLEFAEGQY
ncbi:hypothetical protein G8O30_05730 [Mangrovibacillus cuniculi]|uniref:Exonuclease domain-containing protein n=1 Tax=Mangrovibacillus cuniculi TaxID=2593652 RepID=A0A7S8CAN5_9BACI|nr:hypothetical protein G8O30_05730 [Mangrovibacillus cuniculi]